MRISVGERASQVEAAVVWFSAVSSGAAVEIFVSTSTDLRSERRVRTACLSSSLRSLAGFWTCWLLLDGDIDGDWRPTGDGMEITVGVCERDLRSGTIMQMRGDSLEFLELLRDKLSRRAIVSVFVKVDRLRRRGEQYLTKGAVV